jgi:hypothetical protein
VHGIAAKRGYLKTIPLIMFCMMDQTVFHAYSIHTNAVACNMCEGGEWVGLI